MTTTREEQRDVVRDWLIRKNGYFYRPNRCGYTQEVIAAGLYTEAEARAVALVEPESISAHHISEWAVPVESGCVLEWLVIDRLRASQAGGVPAGWMDISTAPKDGTYVDIWGVNPAGRRFPGVRWTDWPPVGAVDGFTWRDERGVPVVDHADAVATNWMALPSAPGAPPPATDGDALRDTLEKIDAEFDRQVYGLPPREDPTPYALREADQDIPADYQHCVVITEGLWDEIRNALASSPPPVPEIVAPQVVSDATADTGSASAAHLEQILPSPDLGQAAELVKPQCDNPSPAALASVPTPVSDGDSVLRKAVALVITHHVNQNRQKRRPESDSFTLKTLREALAATPVSATDAVKAERACSAKDILLYLRAEASEWKEDVDGDANDSGRMISYVTHHITLADNNLQELLDMAGVKPVWSETCVDALDRINEAEFDAAAIRSRGTDEVGNG